MCRPLLLVTFLSTVLASYDLAKLKEHATAHPSATAADLVSVDDLPHLMRPPSDADVKQFTIRRPIEGWAPQDKSFNTNPENAYIAICTSSRDENPYIREWVAYHRCIGVGKIYIIDDRSRTPMLSQLHDYIAEGYVDYDYVDVGKATQLLAYNDCLSRARGKHKWLLCMDTDEAVVLKPQAGTLNLGAFLSKYEQYSGVVMQWVLFGDSGHVARPQGGQMRNFVACSTVNSTSEGQAGKFYIKTAAQPGFVRMWESAHSAKYYSGYAVQIDDMKPVLGTRLENHTSIEHLQLNHYAVRSFEDFILKNLKGGGDGARRQFNWYLRLNEQASGEKCLEAYDIANQCFGKLAMQDMET